MTLATDVVARLLSQSDLSIPDLLQLVVAAWRYYALFEDLASNATKWLLFGAVVAVAGVLVIGLLLLLHPEDQVVDGLNFSKRKLQRKRDFRR